MTGRYVLMKKRPSPDKKFIIIHSDAMISSAFVLEGTKFSFKRIQMKKVIFILKKSTRQCAFPLSKTVVQSSRVVYIYIGHRKSENRLVTQ